MIKVAQESPSQLSDFIQCFMPRSWSITPYKYCDIGCHYCCTKAQGRSTPILSANEAKRTLEQMVPAIERGACIMLGGLADAYPNAEKELGITRVILESLIEIGNPFFIVSKSTVLLRDLDLLSAHSDIVGVTISLSIMNEKVAKKIEPLAPSPNKRLKLIHSLREAGVSVDVNILPWIPDLTETKEIIQAIPEDLKITLSPLAVGENRTGIKLAGRKYERDAINAAYMNEYRMLGHHKNTSWIAPSPPPQENNPYNRLPQIQG